MGHVHHDHMTTTMMPGMDMNSTTHNDMNMSSMGMDHSGHNEMGSGMHGMHGMHNMGNDSCMGGMMMMFFHTGNCEYILFEQLRTTKTAEMVGACIAIFFLAILYEGLKVFREYLLKRALSGGSKYQEVTIGSNGQSTDHIIVDGSQKSNGNGLNNLTPHSGKIQSGSTSIRMHMISTSHFIQTFLHVLQVFISYCLMLVFMTYNAWLCIAVVLGAGAGYFLFGWKRAIVVDINEHCH